LQDKAAARVSGIKTIPIDVWMIATTNRNLPQMMGGKLIRSDLYYRLTAFPVTTPPLHDHREDIPALAEYLGNGQANCSDSVGHNESSGGSALAWKCARN
jgi:transcriptional regulator with PAS, ATPase and Fis domain